MSSTRPIILCSRGSALAVAQAHEVMARCREAFPGRTFELKLIKTTGDKLQAAGPPDTDQDLPKGLFTKELELALLGKEADIAIHSLKDLPTGLPAGLQLGAVTRRADVREVLIYRDPALIHQPSDAWAPGENVKRGFPAGLRLGDLPPGAVLATSSTRRAAQVTNLRPDVKIVPIRGNVDTRLRKLLEQDNFDATLLAAAGLARLHLDISPRGELRRDPRIPQPAPTAAASGPPAGLVGTILEPEEMLPCVGQGAIGLEIRLDDTDTAEVCNTLNHLNTLQAVTAERSFLHAMGGGCQSPVAAYARVVGHQLYLRAVSFRDGQHRKAEARRAVREAERLGQDVANAILG